jgi:hypothetical protein
VRCRPVYRGLEDLVDREVHGLVPALAKRGGHDSFVSCSKHIATISKRCSTHFTVVFVLIQPILYDTMGVLPES